MRSPCTNFAPKNLSEKMKRTLLLLVLTTLAMLTTALPAAAEGDGETAVEADSLEIGLLTCDPGTEAYELYGHTAVRVTNLKTGRDVVYNYGVFDFKTPHFAWRFMLGQTDYHLGRQSFDFFAYCYAQDGRSVREQLINLTPAEAQRVATRLDSLASLKGWVYRYSFLYDNCTTRAVDDIIGAINGRVEWSADKEGLTFRDIIHEFADDAAPWYSFGQDLILGREMDEAVPRKLQMFAPLYAESYFDGAIIVAPDGSRRPLVKAKGEVVSVVAPDVKTFPLSPLATALLLLAVSTVVLLWERHRGRILHWFDDLLLLAQGLAGCIVGLLFFFSEHPAVGSNWLILMLNPLPLLYLPYKVVREWRGRDSHYSAVLWAEVPILLLMLVVSPQQFPATLYILIGVLAVRAISYAISTKS